MKKIGVISDIHSNIKALETALDILEKECVDRIYVCGDVVGYGAFPNECCDKIRALGCPVAAGNHDWAVAGLTEYKESHSAVATESIDYTKEVLSEKNLHWLQDLPLHHRENSTEFVHASLVKAERWNYLARGHSFTDSAWHDVLNNFAVLKGQVCFVGHSHRPTIFLEKRWAGIKVVRPKTEVFDLRGRRAIVDTGSIGLPRDGSGESSLVVYDMENQRVHFKRFKVGGGLAATLPSKNTDRSVWDTLKSVFRRGI